MNLNWLETLKTVAETRSYTRAAEALYISQPAVSQQIRQLEGYFGAKLVDRRGQQLELTSAGVLAYELACRTLGEVNATRQSILAQVSGSSGLVTIVSTPSPFLHAVPRALGRFWAEHPDVEVKTIVRFGTAITDSVKNGSADLGIHTGLYIDEALERRALADSRVLCVCSPTHPLAGHLATAEDIAHQRVAVVGKTTETRHLIDAWFAEQRCALQDVMEVSSHEEVRIAARNGLAVGFLAGYVAQEDIRGGRLVPLHLEGFEITHPNYVCFRSDARGPVLSLIQTLVEFAAISTTE
jgi:DNA-binding transcriptional LysR family regulator